MSYLPWLAVHKNLEYIFGILPVESTAYRKLKVSVDYQIDQSQSLSFSSYPHLEVLFFSFHLQRFLAYQSKPVYDKLGTHNTGSHLDK